MKFDIQIDRHLIRAWARSDRYLLIHLTAPTSDRASERPPVRVRRRIESYAGDDPELLQIVDELRHQYLLAFEASNRPGWRPIEVSTRDKKHVVRARTGYTAGGSDRPASESDAGASSKSPAVLPATAGGAL